MHRIIIVAHNRKQRSAARLCLPSFAHWRSPYHSAQQPQRVNA